MRKKSVKKLIMSSLAVLFTISLAACDQNTSIKSNAYDFENASAKAAVSGEYVNYVAASYEERTKILGLLEKYAVENFLTGLTLFDNGGYVMYNSRIEKGAPNYIPGYGFGILAEGSITADLATQATAEWKRYYHTYESADPNSINYMNDKGSVVSALNDYITASYWDTKMNSQKNGYEWYSDLAKEKPQPLNTDNGLATKYRWEVKVGAEAKYATLTKEASLTKYNGQEIKLEDYLTPYKTMYNQSAGMARGAEGLTGSGSIKGMQAYYNATKEDYNDEAWEKVGLKAYEESGKSYVEVEFNVPCNPFYAMYYMASILYAPIPAQFLTDIGGIKNYGNFVSGTSRTPVDTYLSTGAYVLEKWDSEQQIVFKKNTLADTGSRYQVAGIHVRILKGVTQDAELAFKEFIAGKLDAVGIPSTKLDEYRNDPRATITVGNSTSKLNLNTTTQERWLELFGPDGTIAQTTDEKDFWNVKPIMSNSDFIKGLNFALNRKELAAQQGRNATADYFADAYLSDPENGVSYNSTQAHADAVKSLREDTELGYNLEAAKFFFKRAAETLIAEGKYTNGQTVEIEIAYQAAADVTKYAAIAKYFEDAFNESGAQLNLKVKAVSVQVWTDIYYKKMMVGQFDIAMGGINGNVLNPLNFMDVLKSDNSSGFTLNWGPDTSAVSDKLQYDGKIWSYDSLYKAAEEGCYVRDGQVVEISDESYAAVLRSSKRNAAGGRDVQISIDMLNNDDVETKFVKVLVSHGTGANLIEIQVQATVENGIVKFQLSPEIEKAIAGEIQFKIVFETTNAEDGQVKTGVITIDSRTTKE